MHFDRRLWWFTAGFRRRIAGSVVLGLIASAAGIARLALLGVLLSQILGGAPSDRIALAAGGVVFAIVLRAVLQFLKEDLAYGTAAAVQRSVRDRLYLRLLELGPAHLAQSRSGALTTTIVESVEQLETFFGQYLPQLFIAAITPIGLFAFMAFLDLPVATVLLVAAIVALLLPSALRRWNEAASLRRRESYGGFAAELIDAIQGLTTLKAFGQSAARRERLKRRADEVFRETMGVLAANSTSGAVTLLGIGFGAAAALVVGVARVGSGDLSPTTLLVVLLLGGEIFRPIRELSGLFHAGLLGVAASGTVSELIDARVSIVDPGGSAVPADASVAFENVRFTYPGRERNALRELDFAIRPGERVGVVGPSGAGKSTLLWLLLRLYDPQDGRVTIGGTDVRALSFDVLRANVAVVLQDPYLFHGTVADNLRVAKPDASDPALEAAAKTAQAHEFIAALPAGYDTVIGERGVRLSGGQRQRIAIARALLRDAPILILDEALSSVDARGEERIQRALDVLTRGRTTIVMAHRLSSVVNADRILVLEDGRLVESGRHADLVSRGGVYARLMAEQAGSRAVADSSEEPSDATPDLAPLAIAPSDDILAASGPGGWRRGFGPLLRPIKPLIGELIAAIALAVLPVVALAGSAFASTQAFSAVRRGADPSGALLVLVLLVPVAATVTWLDSYVSHDLAFRLLARMRIALFDSLERLAPAYLVRRRSGDIVSLATHDVELVEYFYAHTVGPLFLALIPLAIVIGLARVDLRLAGALLPFLVIAATTVLVGRGRSERIGAEARERLGALNAYVIETLQGLRDIVAFGYGPARHDAFDSIARRYLPLRRAFNRERALQHATLEAMIGAGGLAVSLVGAAVVAEGRLDPLALPFVALISMIAFVPLSTLAQTGRQLAETLGAARRLASVQDEPVPVQDGTAGVGTRRPLAVRFEQVRFAYQGTRRAALDGVTFDLLPGRTTALVGPSGAGKTTCAHLLLRFWDPDAGGVLLDGRDLREYRLDELRRCVALVAQETYLFSGTVRENVLIARPDADAAAQGDALQRAGLGELAELLPQGLDTPVGERGLQLSGGQRQRVAIARAFLKDAPILVLDEATSHLDAENERIVRRALDELRADRTTLVIAHRLSTVRDADAIVVLDGGRVSEIGSHDGLLETGGLYHSLVAAQLRGAAAVAS